ncbi:MAG: dihydrolipoamide acetyltransferase [Myxococcota bacterium]
MRRSYGVAIALVLAALGTPALAQGTGEAGAAASTSTGDEPADFNRELLTVEEQVDSLKERVFRSKATLQLLKEIVIEGASTGARATIWHVNKLGNGYRLESITYLLDGQSKFSKADPNGSLSESREFKIHDGAVPPGNHNLSVDFKIRPTGYGIFKYAQSYEIDVRSNYAFEAELGKSCTVRSILTDRGGVANSFEERARVDFEVKCERISDVGPQ